MKANFELRNVVAQAYGIATPYLSTIDAHGKISEQQKELSVNLEKDGFLKVPFVGDFNAGKSSLINAMMGKPDFLPTAITPETAVAYELYYSTTEKLELYHDGAYVSDKPLTEIGKFPVAAGDVVKVYVNNDFVKSMNDLGVVVVDMPGISSGVEQHNGAIMNYIQEGTVFVICSDVEQGTLANSTITFMQEVKAYGLKTMMVVTKSDMKTVEEGEKVRTVVADYVTRVMGEQTQTILASSRNAEQVQVVKDLLCSIDAEALLHAKYDGVVRSYVNDIISAMMMRINILSTKDENIDKKLAALNEEKERVLLSLQEKQKSAQPISESVDDVMRDINNALMQHSGEIAIKLMNGASGEEIENSILSIIRPVFVNSLKRELEEYQLELTDCLRDFSASMQNTINGDNGGVQQILGGMLQRDFLETFFQKLLTKLMTKFAGKIAITTILKVVGGLVGPLVTILVHILPDLLGALFGDKNKRLNEMKQKVQCELIGKLIANVRPNVETAIGDARKKADEAAEEMVKEQVAEYEKQIAIYKEEVRKDEASKAALVAELTTAIESLKALC